ncbi:MAG TPA: flagellar hook capping FlgD N-terminal domain-containing protein [Dongiaceae bacterium]|nr:flagellar hook capping FlgD N-terminal domain-containing protein [Dongiaceae bacterium]
MNTVNALASPSAPRAESSSTTAALPSSQGLNNMFLQLLVAQLQNQSPLNPMDPTQFVGQLAQFSELSEVTQIEQILQQTVSGGTASGTSNPAAHARYALPVHLASSSETDSTLEPAVAPVTIPIS